MRVLPWFTDGATQFLNGYKVADRAERPLDVFEFGCGNSSLYFLAAGYKVWSVDHNPTWVKRVESTANAWGFGREFNVQYQNLPYSNAFVEASMPRQLPFDIVVIDGRNRVDCALHVMSQDRILPGLIVFDNTERQKYMAGLKAISNRYDLIHFEQPPCDFGAPKSKTQRDPTGQQTSTRWITSVGVRKGGHACTTSGIRL